MRKHRLQYDLPMAFRYLANEHNVKTTTKKTSGQTHRRLWTYAVWILFKRDMKILRPSLPSPWRTDHARLLHCLSLFIVCMGTTPGLATASYRWTSHTSLTSRSSQFHPEALQGESRQWFLLSPLVAPRTGSVWSTSSPSLCSSGAQAEDGRAGGLSLASGFIFSC